MNDNEIGLVTYAGFKTETFKDLPLEQKQQLLKQYFMHKVAWMTDIEKDKITFNNKKVVLDG